MKILLIIGLIIFCYDDIKSLFIKLKSLDFKLFFSQVNTNKRKSISSFIKELENGYKPNFLRKSYDDMNIILNKTGEKHKLKSFKILSLISGIIGGSLALYFGAYMLIPINIIGFALIPMWIVKFNDYKYRIRVQAELSVALSTITTAYIRSENLISSVENSLKYIYPPVKSTFENFVNNYKYVDKNINTNIRKMKGEINNKVFRLWCDNLIICIADINYKDSLVAIVNQLDTEKKIQENIKLIINKPVMGMLLLMLISVMVFPVLYMFDPSLPQILFNTLTGQLIVMAMIISLLITLNKAIDLSTAPAE